MENELVRYSRAGDVFHYRWAARRCLGLISPSSPIIQIVIEGSKENKLAGEYVIDVAEYSDSLTKQGVQDVAYYQLKHTTVHKNNPFDLSDLKGTFEGFSARFQKLISATTPVDRVTFTIVTNRPINQNLKDNLEKLSAGERANLKYKNTLSKYTQLSDEQLKKFCTCIKFADGEGDYNAQKYKLHVEISQLVAGSIDNPEIENITGLVRDKALPDSNGEIVREEILEKFRVTSERDLFPAPPEFEELEKIVYREQHETMLKEILCSSDPLIIHAPGGVGKTVFARQVSQSLPLGSIGVVYDCFGGGRYRNRSEVRHHHRQALVQIVNELATQGFCDPLLVNSGASETDILRKFLDRVETAVSALKKSYSDAILVIIIDAADNAEMAAKEFGDSCFVHELLRERSIEGVRIVALCRTERIKLLQPKSNIKQLELEPFSGKESYNYLLSRYPQATMEDGLEFHRLTNGNPRVQSNAMNFSSDTINEMFIKLGAIGATVDEQIKGQLMSAVASLKDKLHDNYIQQIDLICIGLATLPPFIPLYVLSRAADVEESAIRSFVSDLGRPLWLSDSSVQFRDEPTETWFRETYAASKEEIEFFIEQLKLLANEYSYVASALPSLLLQAGKYTDLVELALSDKYLPNNPIDERNIRVYRLQFAFKASLKQKSYVEAIKLALLAGEEVAGDKRQLALLANNVDLIAPLQDEQRVQEFAFRRLFGGSWRGSENVYSAVLLSTVKEFRGEARSFLRAAHNWLSIYFKDRANKREDEAPFHNEQLKDEEIVELVYAHLNLYGGEEAYKFLTSWKPDQVIYRVSRRLFKRLIDFGEISTATEIAALGKKNQYLIIAFAHEFLEVGYFPGSEVLYTCLDLLTTRRARIAKPSYTYRDQTIESLVSFLELCAANDLPKEKIIRVINHYFSRYASRSITSDFDNKERAVYLRAIALKEVFNLHSEINITELIPKELQQESNYKNEQETKELKEVIGGLLPWYLVRIRCLVGHIFDFDNAVEEAKRKSGSARASRYRSYDSLPTEISRICSDILLLHNFEKGMTTKGFYENYIKVNRLFLPDHLKLVRAAFRLSHLAEQKREFEQYACDAIHSAQDIGPEDKADCYINLARSIINVNCDDAAIYFNYAIEAVSKFGDEIVERWEAIVSLANRREVNEFAPYELAYRFIRCAELIGENVAREKYWDRDEAIKTCVRLSPVTALAALSRWRDRELGYFERQLSALASEMVSKGYIEPSVAWSLSAFMTEFQLTDFSLLCINKELSKDRKKFIFDSLIKELRINGVEGDVWNQISNAAKKHSLKNDLLDEIIAYIQSNPRREVTAINHEITSSFRSDLEDKSIDWDKLLHDLDLVSRDGLRQAILRYDEIPHTLRNGQLLWSEVYKRVADNVAVKFLYELIKVDEADLYEIRNALELMPNEWHQKASIKKEWPQIMQLIGNRFAAFLVERGTLSYFANRLELSELDISSIKKGLIEGLTNLGDLANATTFFGFIAVASERISTQEATQLLDFALSRFELHIDEEFADGPWSDALVPPHDAKNAFTGFIWSALGSPKASTRWCAAHCVRRIADTHCSDEMDSLIDWLRRGRVGSFGANKFPFYNLHATLYLLISLARISISNPHILSNYSETFYRFAINTLPHILIQKYASDIALNIESAIPETYTKEAIELLRKIGESPFAKVELEDRWETRDSYWHTNGIINSNLKFYHGYDFDQYWFEPLGKAFGISGDQVEDIATEVIVNEWNIDHDGGYLNDPRHTLWRSSSGQSGTDHSHGSYPQIDNYNFYLSYHAMFVVASKLLEKMPVANSSDWYEDEWKEWLHGHLLTRGDGSWLYDRRDPIPLTRRAWIDESKDSNWRDQITNEDFLEGIFYERSGELWMNVIGSWEDGDSERIERFYISSALVSETTSQSLLNALSTCSNPHDFKIPEYEEDGMEVDLGAFRLKGWVYQEEVSKRLDGFDPHSAKVDYPPYCIGESIIEKMLLSSDSEQREWKLSDEEMASAICEIWTPLYEDQEGDPVRHGNRLAISISFLKKLCLEFMGDLIIEVQISRSYKHKSYMRGGESNEYKPPLSKVFIFSADGRLRDTETYYEFRQSASQRA
ncbi:ATP-binding protein [Paenibacillus jamilae]|nr:ATP-binding protein [Paenibacillus jamilae]